MFIYYFLFQQTGKKICELVGHKRAITAAIVIKKYLDSINDFSDVVVTASSDEIIKVKFLVVVGKGRARSMKIGERKGSECDWSKIFNLQIYNNKII